MIAGYRTKSGRAAVRASYTARLRERGRAREARTDAPVERKTVRVLRQSGGASAVLTVELVCGHRVDVKGPTRPQTAMCTECGKAGS